MSDLPLTDAEVRAEEATKLGAFGINLHNVREKIALILDNWKTHGFFTEYTDHSYKHPHEMLKSLDWLIPEQTKGVMTPADWLMIVLAIYLHDIGLLITKQEYEQRENNSDFRTFVANPILSSEKQKEYIARLKQLVPEEAERIRYQEFVRYTHGQRVRAWLEGVDHGADPSGVRKTVAGLLEDLDETFKRDLARICESHTIARIDDTNIFKLSQPYGGEQETVNLQYAAAILRTVDLLQITKKRAPSVLFQLISPSNPISQIEWQKQAAVRTVRPSPARDRDGVVTEGGISDTIEVHATFKEPDGFFGLTSYLSYAQRELSQTYNAILKSARDNPKEYLFPWRYIDSKGIDTEGFLTDAFEFELDQHKILDLLTGHTLYNDSTVVLRELTQNALDAIRLQAYIQKTTPEKSGHLQIEWDSKDRVLTVTDNGTGMSQEMVVNHLLKVGSSRYQDPKFKESYPTFHSISRFGIGVLSAFMVSDDVEITTCHEDEKKARRIALRSVHGKYLIKLLDKDTDRSQIPMYPHGTSVRLAIRPTAEIGDVLRVARSWLMFPRCRVTLTVDGQEPVEIGFESPKKAIEAFLNARGRRSPYKREYKVEERTLGDVTLAYAIAKDSLFKDWSFVIEDTDRRPRDEDDFPVPTATCIEGVAVERATPGFHGMSILAVANAIGPNAPKTNVARSALEDTVEQRKMLEAVYNLYASHVTDEMGRLATTGDYSLSRAVGLGPFIGNALTNPAVAPVKEPLLTEALATVPLVLIEDSVSRRSISLAEMGDIEKFLTIESSLYRSIENLVRDAPAEITAERLLGMLGNRASKEEEKLPIVCNLSSSNYIDSRIKGLFEINLVEASTDARELKLTWEKIGESPLWLSSSNVQWQLARKDAKFYSMLSESRERNRTYRPYQEPFKVPLGDIKTTGLEEYGSFVINRERHIKPGTELAKYLKTLADNDDDVEGLRSLAAHFVFLDIVQSIGWSWDILGEDLAARVLNNQSFSGLEGFIRDLPGFSAAIRLTLPKAFDPTAWDRREGMGFSA